MPTIVIVDGSQVTWAPRSQIRSFSPLPPRSNSTCPETGLYYYGCACGNHRCGYCGRRQRDQDRGGDRMCQCDRNRRAARHL
jgi:hypothetical protein